MPAADHKVGGCFCLGARPGGWLRCITSSAISACLWVSPSSLHVCTLAVAARCAVAAVVVEGKDETYPLERPLASVAGKTNNQSPVSCVHPSHPTGGKFSC